MAISKREPIEPAPVISEVDERDTVSARNDKSSRAFAESPSRFWTNAHDLEAGPNEPTVIGDVSELQASFWPEDESVDDFVSFVRQERDADRKSQT